MKRKYCVKCVAVVTATLIVLLIGAVAALGQEKAKEPTASKGAGEKVKKQAAARLTGTTLLVSFMGKSYTVDEVKEMIKDYQPGAFRRMPADMLTSMPRAQMEPPLKEMFMNIRLYEKAMKEGFEANERTLDSIKNYEDLLLTNQVYQKEVAEKVGEATEEEAKELYEKAKEKYKKDFSFRVKQIILYTYKKYTVQKGDTLEAIARKVSGGLAAVENIRDAETKEERWVAPEERDTKAFRPLREGEELLVPMPPDEEGAVDEKIKEIYKKLKAGGDFDKLAREYSEGPSPGSALPRITPAKEEKPPLPEIVEAVKKTAVGEYTEVIKTKHGYQILKVEEKTEESVQPFESVKGGLIRQLTHEKRMEAANKYLEELFFNPKYAKQHEEVFSDASATSVSVVAEIGELQYTLGDMQRYHAKELEGLKTAKEKIKLLAKDRRVIAAIVPLRGREMGLDKTEEFKRQRNAKRTMSVAFDYLQEQIRKRLKVTDADILEFYNDNIERYTTPRKYKVRQILKKIGELREMSEEEKQAKIDELKKMLNERKAKIKTKDDFAKVAREISDDPGTKEAGGELRYELTDIYKRGFDGRLPKMKVGEVSEPFVYGAFVYLVRVDDIQEERVSPFSEVKARVEGDVRRERESEIRKETGEKVLKEGGFKLLIGGASADKALADKVPVVKASADAAAAYDPTNGSISQGGSRRSTE